MNKRSKSVIFANTVLLGLAVLFVVAISYKVWVSIYYLEAMPIGWIALLSAGCLTCLLLLRLRPSIKVHLALTSALAIIAVYGGEFLLMIPEVRVSSSISPDLTAAKGREVQFDRRSKGQLINDLRKQGIEIWPATYSRYWCAEDRSVVVTNGKVVVPLSGPSNTSIVMCNESGKWPIYQTDEYGFNNPQGAHIKGSVDVAILGDSFAQGACVQPDEDVASRLRQAGFKALNFGQNASGPLTTLGILTEYVVRLEPSSVVWLYSEAGDLSDAYDETGCKALNSYLDPQFRQHLVEKRTVIDSKIRDYLMVEIKYQERLAQTINRPYAKFAKLFRLRSLLSNRFSDFYRQPGQVTTERGPQSPTESDDSSLLYVNPDRPVLYKRKIQKALPILEDTLKTAQKRVARFGGRLYFVYLPSYERYAKSRDESFRLRNKVLQIAGKLQLPVIDIHQVLGREDNPLVFFPFEKKGHYTEQGYRRVAEAIMARLREEDALAP